MRGLIGWWFNRHQLLIDTTMCIELGLHNVENKVIYHITDRVLEIGTTLYTKDINREIDEGTDKYYIERVAEMYRKSQNAIDGTAYPSRYTCLFVCEKEFVQYWLNKLEKNRQRKHRVYKVKLNGVLFGTYADYLKAEMHWTPNAQFDLEEKEGLFDGEYEIVEECNRNDFSQ